VSDLFVANGVRFLAADDMIVGFCRRTGEEFEPETARFVFGEAAARPGLVLDIGAGTGWYTLPLAAAGQSVRAYEPNPRVFARLMANAALNDLRIEARQCAVSDRRGRATFWHNPRVPLTSGGSIEAPGCAGPASEEVETVSLDEDLDDVADRPVALIKVDVEGHEYAVLEGARMTIERWRPALVLEANTEAAEQRLRAWLMRAGGYVVRNADGRNLLCTPAS